MAKTIDIDFDKLDKCIVRLEKLLNKLEEPSYNDLEFWLSDVGGSGIALKNLYSFCNDTIKFHNAVYSLIDNTTIYLKEIKKIQEVDESIAENL